MVQGTGNEKAFRRGPFECINTTMNQCFRKLQSLKACQLYLAYTTLGVINLADVTVSKRFGTSYQIEIHFTVVNHLYLLFSFVKLAGT